MQEYYYEWSLVMIVAASSKNLFSLNIVTIETHFYLSDPFLNLSFGKERKAVRLWILRAW